MRVSIGVRMIIKGGGVAQSGRAPRASNSQPAILESRLVGGEESHGEVEGFESPPSPSLGVGWRDIMLDIIGVYVTILEMRDEARKEKYETEKQF